MNDPDIQLDDDIVLDDETDKVAPYGLAGVVTGKSDAPGKAQSFGRGALQGASLSFGDEISAAIDTGLSKIPVVRDVAQKLNASAGGSGGGLPLNAPAGYQERRDAYRAKNTEASTANPISYGAGQAVGSLAAPAPGVGAAGSLGRALSTGAAVGGLYGAGASDAPLGWETAEDAALAAGEGVLLGGGLHAGGATAKGAGKLAAGAVGRSAARGATPIVDAVKDSAAHAWKNGHVVVPAARVAAVAADEALAAITRKLNLNRFALKTAAPEAVPKLQAEIASLEKQMPTAAIEPAAPEPVAPSTTPVAPDPPKPGPHRPTGGRAPNLTTPEWKPGRGDPGFAKRLNMPTEEYRAMMGKRTASASRESLHKFVTAAHEGNPFAAKTLRALASTPEGAAKIAAAELELGVAVEP